MSRHGPIVKNLHHEKRGVRGLGVEKQDIQELLFLKKRKDEAIKPGPCPGGSLKVKKRIPQGRLLKWKIFIGR